MTWEHFFSEHLLSSISFLLTIVFLSMLLRSRKSPTSTLAWLLLITAAPYLGIPFYLVLSGRKIKKPTRRKNALYSRMPFHETPGEANRIERILLAAGGPARTANESVEFLATGKKAFDSVMELLESAHRSIFLETFILGNDPIGATILEHLARRAREGLDVRILVDAVGSVWMNHPSFKEVRNAGAKVAYFLPLTQWPFRGRAHLRNHRKMIVIDSREAIVGGMNLARQYLGPDPDPSRWIDLSLRIRGDTVKDLENIFLSDWTFVQEESDSWLLRSAEHRATSTTWDGPLLQVAASGPDVPSDPLYDALLSAIFQARQRIWIASPYFIPDEALTKALELAAKRGVDVRILLPRKSNHFFADLGRGSFLRELQSAGASIHLHPRMIHAKVTVFDQNCALIGSANTDMRSLLLNYEIGVFLYSELEIQKTIEWFDPLFAKSTVGFGETGFFRELAEGVGRLFSPIL